MAVAAVRDQRELVPIMMRLCERTASIPPLDFAVVLATATTSITTITITTTTTTASPSMTVSGACVASFTIALGPLPRVFSCWCSCVVAVEGLW